MKVLIGQGYRELSVCVGGVIELYYGDRRIRQDYYFQYSGDYQKIYLLVLQSQVNAMKLCRVQPV